MKVYHGSHYKIKNIDFNSCHLGWHAGNLCLAIDLANPDYKDDHYDWENTYVYVCNIRLNKKNHIEIPDIFLYDDDFINTLKRILKASIKNQIPSNKVYNEIDKCETESDIRLLLVSSGILYIKYKNNYETKGYSYCILNEDIDIKEYNLYNYITNFI